MADFQTWAENDPIIKAQRARAAANAAASDAEDAKARAARAASVARQARGSMADFYREKAANTKQHADNVARYAAHMEQLARNAEVAAKTPLPSTGSMPRSIQSRLPRPAPVLVSPGRTGSEALARQPVTGCDSLAKTMARHAAAEAEAAQYFANVEARAANNGWSRVHGNLNARLATGRNRGARR